MKKLFLAVMAVCLSAYASAQTSQETELSKWKIGVSAGYTNNAYKMSTSYQADWTQSARGGATIGIAAQYDFTDWLGVRADLQWMQRNYRNKRNTIAMQYDYTNNYLQLPVMASFSFGGSKLRGFLNTGIFGGYWMSSNVEVDGKNILADTQTSVKQHGMINSDRDNRFVFGYVAGAGVNYRFTSRLSAQIEIRYYHDVTSQVKQYQLTKDHRYNSTLALQTAFFYNF